MRLLFLTSETCPTFRADVNILFGKYLPRHGIYSDIVAGKTPGHKEEVRWGGGEVFLCDTSGGQTRRRIKTFIHGVRYLFCADKTHYQAIQVRDMPVLATIGLIAARIKRLPFYYWMSFPIPEGQIELAKQRGLSSGLIKFLYPWIMGRVGRFLLYRIVMPSANHVFVQSDGMKQEMIEFGFDNNKMTSVPMGVDCETVRPDLVEPSTDPRILNCRLIAYLGTLDRPRCIEILFEMLALVVKQVPDARLVLVGDTHDQDHRAWLKQQAESSGMMDKIIWTGWLPMAEGWRYVRAAEIGLSPFPRGRLLDSASPTKVPEYLALGIPVVCNDNPDQKEVVNACDAGYCVAYTPESFAEAVIAIFNTDDKRIHEMSTAGVAYVRHCRDYAILGRTLAETYVKLAT